MAKATGTAMALRWWPPPATTGPPGQRWVAHLGWFDVDADRVAVKVGFAGKGLCHSVTGESGALHRGLRHGRILGHASLDTTRRYLDATAQGLRHVIQGHPSQIALRHHLRTTSTNLNPPSAEGNSGESLHP